MGILRDFIEEYTITLSSTQTSSDLGENSGSFRRLRGRVRVRVTES